MNVSFRNIDKTIFQEFKSQVVKNDLKLGAGLNFALKQWLENNSLKKQKGSLRDIKPWAWKCGRKLSSSVDEILYK